MTYYKLFLTKDNRTGISYNHFIGNYGGLPVGKIIKKVKLGDVLAKNYQKEKVLLKIVNVVRGDIIEVEVNDGIL